MDSNITRQKNVVLSGLNQIYSSTIEEVISFDQITQILVNNLIKKTKLSSITKESIEAIINNFNINYKLEAFEIKKYRMVVRVEPKTLNLTALLHGLGRRRIRQVQVELVRWRNNRGCGLNKLFQQQNRKQWPSRRGSIYSLSCSKNRRRTPLFHRPHHFHKPERW